MGHGSDLRPGNFNHIRPCTSSEPPATTGSTRRHQAPVHVKKMPKIEPGLEKKGSPVSPVEPLTHLSLLNTWDNAARPLTPATSGGARGARGGGKRGGGEERPDLTLEQE